MMLEVSRQLRQKIDESVEWLYSTEWAGVSQKIIGSMGLFVVGDPIGFIFPLVVECTDIAVRKRFTKHVPDLMDSLEQKRSQLNLKYVHSSEGQKLLKDTLRTMIQETNEEKIKYLKQFLVTRYTSKNTDSELANMFFKILINMEPIHINLLAVLKNPREIILSIANKRKNNPRPEDDRPYGKHDCAVYWSEDKYDDLNQFYLASNLAVYSNAHNDLVTWNILKAKIPKFLLYFDPDTFDSNMESSIRNMTYAITPVGTKFLDYIYDM